MLAWRIGEAGHPGPSQQTIAEITLRQGEDPEEVMRLPVWGWAESFAGVGTLEPPPGPFQGHLCRILREMAMRFSFPVRRVRRSRDPDDSLYFSQLLGHQSHLPEDFARLCKHCKHPLTGRVPIRVAACGCWYCSACLVNRVLSGEMYCANYDSRWSSSSRGITRCSGLVGLPPGVFQL